VRFSLFIGRRMRVAFKLVAIIAGGTPTIP
jgi:hypothetical protein